MLATLLEIEASAQAGKPPNPHFPYWMLTLSLGKALTRAALDWGEAALAELSALESAAATARQTEGRRKKKGEDPGKRAHGKAGSAISRVRGTK